MVSDLLRDGVGSRRDYRQEKGRVCVPFYMCIYVGVLYGEGERRAYTICEGDKQCKETGRGAGCMPSLCGRGEGKQEGEKQGAEKNGERRQGHAKEPKERAGAARAPPPGRERQQSAGGQARGKGRRQQGGAAAGGPHENRGVGPAQQKKKKEADPAPANGLGRGGRARGARRHQTRNHGEREGHQKGPGGQKGQIKSAARTGATSARERREGGPAKTR